MYGSLYEPIAGGSRGGSASNGSPGPRGGGKIRIIVGAILNLDGQILTDGLTGASGAGGGSGGAVWVTAGTFEIFFFFKTQKSSAPCFMASN